MSLIVRDKNTGAERWLLTTVAPENFCWYTADEYRYRPVSIDSIPGIYNVAVYNEKPLRLIVEGCPDMRNVYSYLIDVDSRKACYIPATNGFLGETEEGYLIFSSYQYVSDSEIAGRYTLIQVFDPEVGCMVDSLDLEHLILEKYQ